MQNSYGDIPHRADELVAAHLVARGFGRLAEEFLASSRKKPTADHSLTPAATDIATANYTHLEQELLSNQLSRSRSLEAALPAGLAAPLDLAWDALPDLSRRALPAQLPCCGDVELEGRWEGRRLREDLAAMKALPVEATSFQHMFRKTAVARDVFYDSLLPDDPPPAVASASTSFTSFAEPASMVLHPELNNEFHRVHRYLGSLTDMVASFQNSTESAVSLTQELIQDIHDHLVLSESTDTPPSQSSSDTQQTSCIPAGIPTPPAGVEGNEETVLLEALQELTEHLGKQTDTPSTHSMSIESFSSESSADMGQRPATPTPDPPFECYQLKVISVTSRTGLEPCKVFPITPGTVIAGRYRIERHMGTAAFSRAVAATDLYSQQSVCIKIIENSKEFLDQSFDEIKILLYLNKSGDPDAHHVLRLYDYFYFKEHLFIVTELLGQNLYDFSQYKIACGDSHFFNLARVRQVARQVLHSLDYTHSLGIIHADLKPENILLWSYSKCLVKVIDFGSSAFLGDSLSSYVQSRSYRAPEVVLGLQYDQRVDIWSLGCILFELLTGKVLFVNDSIQSLIVRILAILGPFPERLHRAPYASHFFTKDGLVYERVPRDSAPTSYYFYAAKRTTLYHLLSKYVVSDPGASLFVHFISELLILDPSKRPTAAQALRHPYLNC